MRMRSCRENLQPNGFSIVLEMSSSIEGNNKRGATIVFTTVDYKLFFLLLTHFIIGRLEYKIVQKIKAKMKNYLEKI